MLVYCIQNLINNKRYIGQTTKPSIKERYKTSLSKTAANQHLRDAVSFYGEDKFKIDILIKVNNIKELDYWEQYYIDFYETLNPDKGYNLCAGGHSWLPTEVQKEQGAIRNGTRPFNVYRADSGIFVGSWKNKSKCVRDLNLTKHVSSGVINITKCLRKERLTVKGFIFAFLDDPKPLSGDSLTNFKKEKKSNIMKNYFSNPENRIRASETQKELMTSEKIEANAKAQGQEIFYVFDLKSRALVGSWANSATCAKELGLRSSRTLRKILKGLGNSYKGYYFSYKNLLPNFIEIRKDYWIKR